MNNGFEIQRFAGTLSGTNGRDVINNTADEMLIYGYDNNDRISNSGASVRIFGGAGNDIVYNEGAQAIIDGGYGNDSIHNMGEEAKLYGGAGEDTIYNEGSNSTVYGGDGHDDIQNWKANVTINGGSGNDNILNYGSGEKVLLDGSADNDSIYNYASYVTIDGGAGYDSIYNYGSSVSINGGAGYDSIYNYGSSISIDAGAGNDYIHSAGSYSTINGGAGADLIALAYSSAYGRNTVSGGAGNDAIYFNSTTTTGNVFVYNPGDGKDTIYGATKYDTISIAGDYSTTAANGNVVVKVGDGAITLVGAENKGVKIRGTLGGGDEDVLPAGISVKGATLTASSLFTDTAIDLADYDTEITQINAAGLSRGISIIGTAADNSIKGGGGADTIFGDLGNDTVSLGGGADVYVYSGGNDLIQDYAAADTIQLDHNVSLNSVSTVSTNVVFGTSQGNFTVKSGKGKIITVRDSNSKQVYPTVDSRNVTLSGGADDYSNAVADATIYAQAGNDSILNTGANVLVYAEGGNDTIFNWGRSSTLLGGNGADVISNAEGGVNAEIDGGSDNDSIVNYASLNSPILGGSGNDSIYNFGYARALLGESGNDYLYNGRGSITLDGGVGNDWLYNEGGARVTMLGGDGADSITNIAGNYVYMNAGAGNDLIVNSSGNANTILGGSGNDTVYLNSTTTTGNVFVYTNGDGSDTIYNVSRYDTVSISGALKYSTTASGNNVIVSVGSGKMTFVNAKGTPFQIFPTLEPEPDYPKSLTASGDKAEISDDDATIYALGGNDSLTITGSNGYFDGGTGNDKISISGGANNVTVYGSAGNDTIYSNGAGNVFVYASGDGSDTIYNVSRYDTVSISGASYSTTASGNNVIVSVGSGKMTFVNAKGTPFQIFPTLEPEPDYPKSLTASGDKAEISDDDATVYALGGNDSLTITGSNGYFDGGTGNDKISISGGANNVTVYGSAGNDTLYSNGAGNVFVYASGDGSDTIYNVSRYDTVSISGASYSTTASGNNVIVSVGSGKMTFVNAKGTPFQIFPTLEPEPDYPKSLTASGDKAEISDDDATIYALGGNDSLTITGSNGYFDGGTGNDKISISGGANNVTVYGSAGNDTIYSNGAGNVFVYASGDGSDTIYNVSRYDTVSISGASYSTTASGNNVIVSVGSGKMTFVNAKGTPFQIFPTLEPEPDYPKSLTASGDKAEISDDDATVYALGGNDSLTITGSNGYFDGGTGNDKISISGGANNVTVYGSAGNDTLYSNGAGNVFVYANGDGSDTIYNVSRYDTVSISGASYSTTASGNNVIVSVGSGKMTFVNAKGTPFQIFPTLEPEPDYPKSLTASGDKAEISDDDATVYALGGNDSLTITGSNGYFDGGTGNDKISISGSANNVTVSGGAGNDTILNTASNVLLNGDAGNDKISLGSGATGVTLSGGAGNDTLYTNGDGNLLQFGTSDGKDHVVGFSGSDSIQLATGKISSLKQNNANVLVTVNGSANVLTLKDTRLENLSVSGGVITYTTIPPYPMSLTASADNVTISDDEATVYALGGNDFIKITGSDGYFDGGAGNDKLSLGGSASNVTLCGGTGTDTIYSNGTGNVILYAAGDGSDTITGGSADDTLKITGGKYSLSGSVVSVYYGETDSLSGTIKLKNTALKIDGTLKTLETVIDGITYLTSGSDKYENTVDGATLDAMAGADNVTISANDVSVSGGAGNDTISLSDDAFNVTINGGAGVDKIYTNGRGNIIEYAAGEDKDTIYGFGGADSVKFTSGTFNTRKSGANTVVYNINSSSNQFVIAGVDSENLQLRGDVLIFISREDLTFELTNRAESFHNDLDEATVLALGGKDTLTNISAHVLLDGGADNDVLSLSGGAFDVTLIGGEGSDKIYTNGKSNLIQYGANGGNDTIYGFGGDDSIEIAGTVSQSMQNGENVMVTVGSDAQNVIQIVGADIDDLRYTNGVIVYGSNEISLSGGDDTKIIYDDKTRVYALGGNDKITITGNGDTVFGGAGKDNIFNNGRSAWIDGGADNDTIRLGENAEFTTINGGTGNDSIVAGDNISANLFLYASGDGNDTIIGFSRGDSISVTSGAISSQTYSGTNAVFKVGSGQIVLRDMRNEEFKIEGNVITFKDSVIRQTIPGTSRADNIANSLDNVIIDAYAGSDMVENRGNSVTIYGGAGADKIFSGGSDGLIDGGADNDTLSLTGAARNFTLNGGSGNDAIYTNGNSNVINYAQGDGKDTIYGFGGSDSLKITSGSITNTSQKGADFLVTIGAASSAITLKNVTGEVEGNVIISRSSNGYWFADDDNFISDAVQLDEISASDFAVTSIGSFENIAQIDLLSLTSSAK